MTDTPPKPKRTQGKIAWFANRKTGTAYLATPNRGRVFVLSADRNRQILAQDHKPDCDGNCRGCGIMKPIHEFGEADHNGEVAVDHPDLNHLVYCWNAHEELVAALKAQKFYRTHGAYLYCAEYGINWRSLFKQDDVAPGNAVDAGVNGLATGDVQRRANEALANLPFEDQS